MALTSQNLHRSCSRIEFSPMKVIINAKAPVAVSVPYDGRYVVNDAPAKPGSTIVVPRRPISAS